MECNNDVVACKITDFALHIKNYSWIWDMRLVIKIVILPILIGVFFILVKKGFIFERIRHTIIRKSYYKVEIEKIDGNIFTCINLKGVRYGEVFDVPNISISYTPWSIIRRKIKRIDIQAPILKLTATGEGGSIGLPFNIDCFTLKDGKVLNVPYIKTIESFTVEGSLKKSKINQIIRITDGGGNFEVHNKVVQIKKIESVVSLSDSIVSIDTFSIRTKDSEIRLYGRSIAESIDIRAFITKLDVEEIAEEVKGEVTAELHIMKDKNGVIVRGNVYLKKGKYKERFIGELETDLTMVNKELEMKIRTWSIGETRVNGNIYIDFKTAPFSYTAVLNGEDIDLVKLYPTLAGLPASLDGEVKIQGKGEEFWSNVRLYGTIRDTKLESIETQFRRTKTGIEIISLKGIQAGGKIIANGNIGQDSVRVSLSGKGIEVAIFLPKMVGKSNFDFIVEGLIKNPGIFGTFYIKDFETGIIKSDYLSGNLRLTNLIYPEGEVELDIVNLNLYKNKFETCKATFTATKRYANYEIVAHGESMDFKLKGDGEKEKFVIRNLSFYSPKLQVSNLGNIELKFSPRETYIEDCDLLINDSLVQIKGVVAKDKLDLVMGGKNLNLNSISDTLSGTANFTCNITGIPQNPIINLASEITNFSYKTIQADRVILSALYQDKSLHIEKGEFIKGEEKAKISGIIPITFPIQFLDKPMDIDLTLSKFGEELFYPYRNFAELKEGETNGKLKIKGTLKHPDLYGKLNMAGKAIDARFIGTTLDLPRAELEFEKDKINISSFNAKTPNGFLNLKGNILLPDQLDLKVKAQNITIKSIEDVDADVTADFDINGTVRNPILQGNVKIEEAVVTMPFEKPKTVNLQYPIDYDLTISFPGKLWIRNAEADAEVSGEVKVRKKGNEFFLSGDMAVKEGYYYYLERPFKIEKGEIKFINSPELNPKLELASSTTVNYTILKDTISVDTSCIVKLNVGGTLREPKFDISAIPPMPLQDIMSLLSLNMTLDDFLKLGKTEYPQTVGLKAVSYYLLRKTDFLNDLKSQIGVDALRLETELFGKERKARFNVGKYVSRDLYVSWVQDIFSTSKYELKAEYSPWKYGALIGRRTEEGEFKTGVEFKFRY
ncbi:MAG: translocation/assembly module TamB domain-containing protein [bacterium]|nr:translocation/assembly module TamB domain-containing protein [bacterium]